VSLFSIVKTLQKNIMLNMKKIFNFSLSNKSNLDAIKYKRCYLPRNRSNEELDDDNRYANSAIELVEALSKYTTIGSQTRILDFGSGQGRLATGLFLTKSRFASYVGIDTNKGSIEWCKRWISGKRFRTQFIHLPGKNERYNPNATELLALPSDIGQFDIIFLNSVFSHMMPADVKFYLKEFSIALREGGLVFMTAHIDEHVQNVEENPIDYLGRESVGALHRVRYEKEYFTQMVRDAGFNNITFSHRAFERTGQSIVTAKH
jgi:SAM-dependent methyltransferase